MIALNRFYLDINNASSALANRKTQVEQVQSKIENGEFRNTVDLF